MKRDLTVRIVVGAFVVLLLAGPLLPRWAMFLTNVLLFTRM